ncbi:MAG: hypothetical protein CSA81_07670 [Acidobacteria bacterium]|nr:MAG: hypothetical protein CSA81_07670 [Acidobacteriota bacterium]
MFLNIIGPLLILFAQQVTDVEVKFKTTDKGFQYINEPMPDGIQLMTLDGEKTILEINTPTLVQVWSMCCGGDALQWADQRYMEQRYSKKGLRVVSINFENGLTRKKQQNSVREFMKSKDKPAEIYLDPMGWAYEDLKISGFPTYVLISQTGNIVLKTSGKSEEGIALLESEIENLLENMSNN